MWIADIQPKSKEQMYEFSRKMQELGITWSSGRPFTANQREWNTYRKGTWYTFERRVDDILKIYYGSSNQTENIFSLEQILNIHTLEDFNIFINSLREGMI